MKSSFQAIVMVALVLTLFATSAAAMVTKEGYTLLPHAAYNVTRIDQRALVWCTRNCTNMHQLEISMCNAQGSAFRSMRLKNATAARASAATVGKCATAATLKFRDCKAQCAGRKKQL